MDDIKLWPLEGGIGYKRPMVTVQYKNQKTSLSAEEITSMILIRLREIAEGYLGCEVKDAVITVPSSFGDSRRRATKAAAEIAGLNVMRLINEPSAAAIAYGLRKNFVSDGQFNVLVLNLGGGTLDVSLMTLQRGVYVTRANASDGEWGGIDFDRNLVKYLLEELQTTHKDFRMSCSKLAELRRACEKAKKTLSTEFSADICIDNIFDGTDFRYSVSRAKFESVNACMFDWTIQQVEICLIDAGIDRSSVSEVILVGGWSRMPRLRELLRDFFQGDKISKSGINPDEVAVYGAAIQAVILSGKTVPFATPVCDITCSELFFRVTGGFEDIICFENDCRIPMAVNFVFPTTADNQVRIELSVYEVRGVRDIMYRWDSLFVGDVELLDIPPAPNGSREIQVCFAIDESGILHVAADCRNDGTMSYKTITNDGIILTDNDIQEMIARAKKRKCEDQKLKRQFEARNDMLNYAYKVSNGLKLIDDAVKKSIRIHENNKYLEVEQYTMATMQLQRDCQFFMASINPTETVPSVKQQKE